MKGDCSDVMVTMSRIYSILRGDEVLLDYTLHFYRIPVGFIALLYSTHTCRKLKLSRQRHR
jgi:hypothetical protein